MTDETTLSARTVLHQLMQQYRLPQAILVATQLGIADLLADGPKSAGELVQSTGTHPPTLHLLLRALASAAVFTEEADGRFSLTPLSTCLRADTPDSWRDWVLSHGEIEPRVWSEPLHTVQTGRPAFERAFGSPFYDYLVQHADLAKAWDRSMEQSARDWFTALPTLYDFRSVPSLVDVGGGRGTLLAAVLKATPTLRGILFDLPHVVAGAGRVLEGAGVADRCEVVAGDMFTGVRQQKLTRALSVALLNRLVWW